MSIDLEALLAPVSPDRPAGDDLRYHPLSLQIKEARRSEEAIAQGVWKTDVKAADYAAVLKLAVEGLSRHGKDLQVAAWLAEALLYLDGLAGFRQGLELVYGLMERYWDSVHPELEDGDAELRAVPLRWLANLGVGLRRAPVSKAGHTWTQYKDSRTVPTEEEARNDPGKQQARQEALQEGKIGPDDFERAFQATPPEFYQSSLDQLGGLRDFVETLGRFCDERFGDSAPDFGPLRALLDEIQQTVRILGKRKGGGAAGGAPAPAGAALPAAAASAPMAAPSASYAAGPAGQAGLPEPETGGPASDPDQAYERIFAAVRILHRITPGTPVAYAVPRAVRWAELRAVGSEDPSFLEAPPREMRVDLKRLAAEGNWDGVLELAERGAALPCGRAWLDLHRYAVTACRYRGHELAATQILAELRALLADFPELPSWTLADDTPAANNETAAWLQEENLTGGGAGLETAAPPLPAPPPAFAPPPVWRERTDADAGEGGGTEDAFERALEAVRNGQAEEAIDQMSQEVARERSGRRRFLRKMQLAQVCMASSNPAIALPVLRELAGVIEQRGLEVWESEETIAEVYALLYQCIGEGAAYPDDRQRIYEKLCCLDPSRALRLVR